MRIAVAVVLVAVEIGWTAAPTAQSRPAPPAPAPSATAASELQVDVRSRAVRPGEVLAIGVQAPETVTAVNASLGDRAIPMWRVSPRTWRGVAGLDVEQPPGPLALAITATAAQGARLARTLPLDVQPGSFAERHLNVAPRFVDPPESERPRIEREAVRLHAIYDSISTARSPGPFVPPVPHRRSSPFGSRSVFNGQARDRHAGLDFASPAGAEIRAPAAGRVALVAPLYFTGNTVVLDHGYGVYSILAHLQRTMVVEGQVVARGARLGTVGATGRATAPHLHWSVRMGSTRVDPAAVLDVLAAPPAAPERPTRKKR
jgi:murein DD-endopeptidase MepM/ murein hydrolase activator NlpD